MAPTRSSSKKNAADSHPERSNVSLSPKVDRASKENLEISIYEKVRLENIRRNELFLAELGVASIRESATAGSRPPISMKPKVKKPTTAAPPMPVRRSSRVTSEKLSSEIKALQDAGKGAEAEAKQKELDDLLASKAATQTFAEEYLSTGAASSGRYERIADPVSLRSALDGDDIDVALLRDAFQAANSYTHSSETLSGGRSSGKGKARTSSDSHSSVSLSDDVFASLQLSGEDVVKLTPQRMTSVALHPSSTKYLAAGGDKTGVLTLWDVDHPDKMEGGGIYQYKPHVSNVTKLSFSSHSLLSTSYDGTLRQLDLDTEAFSLIFTSPESLSDMYFTDSVAVRRDSVFSHLVAKSDGHLALIDSRVSSTAYQFDLQLFDSKISAVDIHPTEEHVVLTSSSRSGIALHDLRKATTTKSASAWKPLFHMTPHSKSINAIQFSTSGEFFVSVSLDDTIKTWAYNRGSVTQSAANTIRHNNFTGRWLSTFKPVFDPKRPATFAMGSMLQPRRMEIFTVSPNKQSFSVDLVANLTGEYIGSVNSRIAFHPALNAVLGSNSSGKVHLFR